VQILKVRAIARSAQAIIDMRGAGRFDLDDIRAPISQLTNLETRKRTTRRAIA